MELRVNEAVLIPRPETEELVEWVLNEKTERKDGEILDIGTGSGCIPIAIKKNWPEANLFAMDVSEAALEVAKANAMLQQTPIAFLHADILNESSWPAENFDIIISNPPYIPQQERQLLDKHVTEWEPHLALFVPANDPLMFYRKIGTFAKQHLSPGGVLYFECHQQFASLVVAILEKQGFTANLKQDLFGNDRMVRARVNQH
jgi:release factor glutamine methyltransferase